MVLQVKWQSYRPADGMDLGSWHRLYKNHQLAVLLTRQGVGHVRLTCMRCCISLWDHKGSVDSINARGAKYYAARYAATKNAECLHCKRTKVA